MNKEILAAVIVGIIVILGMYATLGGDPAGAANPALFEADLSPTTTTTGEYCSLDDRAFNISVYYTSTGGDPGVTIQRSYRGDSTQVWRDIKEYTESTETIEVNSPNPGQYWYRAKYTGSTGAAHVRIDQ